MSDRTDPVTDPERLAALERTGLLDSPPDEAFDDIARRAADITGAPTSFVSLVDEDRQFFKSTVSTVPSKVTPGRESSLLHSLCRHAVAEAAPLILEDARSHAFFGSHPAVQEFGIGAYVGMPISLDGPHVVGTLCVVDSVPRLWSTEQIEALRSLADETARVIAQNMRETDAAIERTIDNSSGGEQITPADRLAAAAAFFLSKHDAYVDRLRSGNQAADLAPPVEEQRHGEVLSARAGLLRALEMFQKHEPPPSGGSTQSDAFVLRDRAAEFLTADHEQRRIMLGFRRGLLPLDQAQTAVNDTTMALDSLRLAFRSYEDSR